jgi:predicted ester cyclase
MNEFWPNGARRSKIALALAALVAAGGAAPAAGNDIPTPAHLIVSKPAAADAAVSREIHGALLFYAGWNTGKASYFQQALAPTFVDNTLPAGRPQGPTGPPAASAQFRNEVPDLRCAVEDLIVAGDEVTVRQRYTGTAVNGRHVDFVAIDVLRMHDGKIAEDWHLEDYTTLNRQFGKSL